MCQSIGGETINFLGEIRAKSFVHSGVPPCDPVTYILIFLYQTAILAEGTDSVYFFFFGSSQGHWGAYVVFSLTLLST